MPDRICYMIDRTMCNEAGEWVPAVVTENQSGYHQTNWTWKCTFEQAEKYVEDLNAKMGVSKEDAWLITASSMGAQHQLSRARHTRLDKLPLLINSKSTDVQEILKKRLSHAK